VIRYTVGYVGRGVWLGKSGRVQGEAGTVYVVVVVVVVVWSWERRASYWYVV